MEFESGEMSFEVQLECNIHCWKGTEAFSNAFLYIFQPNPSY